MQSPNLRTALEILPIANVYDFCLGQFMYKQIYHTGHVTIITGAYIHVVEISIVIVFEELKVYTCIVQTNAGCKQLCQYFPTSVRELTIFNNLTGGK